MLEQAMDRITEEMTADEKQPYVQVVGRFLLQHLENNPEHAEKFLVEDKTITKSLDVMRRFAQSKRVGNVAVLTDDECFGVVLQYFDCWEGEQFEIPAEPERPAYTPPTPLTATTNRSAKPASASKTSVAGKPTTSNLEGQLSLF